MQGSILVKMPDNNYRLFNVDKNNGYVYDKKIKDPKDQKRYWYFREIKDRKKENVFLDKGGAIFAGDIYNIGLGKIIAIMYQNPSTKKEEIRVGVLADAGGAFTNNLYQLDLFAGVFRSKSKFNQWLSNLPNAVEAYILVKS